MTPKKSNRSAILQDETNDYEDDIFSVTIFSDADRKTHRSTARIKDNVELAAKDAVSDSKWSLLEDSKMERDPKKGSYLSKEAEHTADKMLGATQLEHSNKKVKYGEENPLYRLRPEGIAELLGDKTPSNILKEKLFLNNDTVENDDRRMGRGKAYTPKYSVHFSKRIINRENKTSSIRDTNRRLPAKGTNMLFRDMETPHIDQLAPQKRKPAIKTLSKSLSQGDAAKALANKMAHLQPALVANQSPPRSSNYSYPKYVKSNATLARVLAIGNLTSGRCKPLNNFAMLKTHKCSSSTLQNILYRWGDDHNLTFILPLDGVYLGHPEPFSIEYAQRVAGDTYNILANHARYDEKGETLIYPFCLNTSLKKII